MNDIDDNVLLRIFEYAKPHEFQILRLICTRFNSVIETFDCLYLNYLRSLFEFCPFYWLEKIPFSQRGSILLWIVKDLKLIKKLQNQHFLHYPTIPELLIAISSSLDEKSLGGLYNLSFGDANLTDITNYLTSFRNKVKGGISGAIWNLRFDIVFKGGLKQLHEYNETQILERLSNIGIRSDFCAWYPYFKNYSHYDFSVLDDLKNFQDEHFIYKDNLEFIIFLRRLDKLHHLSIINILKHKNFETLHYLMDNFPSICETGIQIPTEISKFAKLLKALSFYKGKRGKDVFCWLKKPNFFVIDNVYPNLHYFPEFRNLELLKLIIGKHQLDYSQHTFYYSLNSFKVYSYLRDNFNYSHNNRLFSCVSSVKVLIDLLQNGYKIISHDISTVGFQKENLQKLIKKDPKTITEYFRLLYSSQDKLFTNRIIATYLKNLVENAKTIYDQYAYTEDDIFKVCKCMLDAGCDLSSTFDYDVVGKLKEKHLFNILLWLHRNRLYDFEKPNFFSMMDRHGFRLFLKKYTTSNETN